MSSRMQGTRTGISDMARTAQEGEIKRAATLKMSAEARLLRHQELERIRKMEEDENTDDSSHVKVRDLRTKGPNGSQTTASSSHYSSRHSSIEPSSYTSGSYGNDPRELKRLLTQLEEKYREVLVINAQLDCEKQFLTYSVDLLKDKLEDATESSQYNQKCAADRKRELAYQRMQLEELNHQLELARHQIAIRDELITERGLVLVNADGTETITGDLANGDTSGGRPLVNGAASDNIQSTTSSNLLHTSSSYSLLSKANAEALKSIGGSDIDGKLATLLAERAKDKERIETLKQHLAEERERVEMVQKIDTRAKGGDPENLKQAIQAARSQAQDYKFRLEQANQKITGLEGDIIRLEGQVKRFKTIAENSEMQEDQLKQERRKLQRELREAHSTIDDLKSENSTLQRRIDKLSRGAPGVPSGSSLRSYRGSSQAR
ncbi:hypothetical protein Aperf_G00000037086 [Anoplocephala perfoliata]